ncbi:MAG TPA: ferredoxin [Mycobacteriales bacterium]|nr:ferredoxin [Mycobacteriales bacterium]
MRIVLDQGKCSSLGMCEAVAPDVFEVGDDGALQLLQPEPPEDRRGQMEEAVAACPTGALTLEG